MRPAVSPSRIASAVLLLSGCCIFFVEFSSDQFDRQSARVQNSPTDRFLATKGAIVAQLQEITMSTASPTSPPEPRLPGAYLKLRYTGGRIGNDLFSYASAFGLSKKYGLNLCINTRDGFRNIWGENAGGREFKLELYFVGPFDFCPSAWNRNPTYPSKRISGGWNRHNFDQRKISNDGDDIEVTGFLQSFANFRDVEEELAEALTFKDEVQVKADEILQPYRDSGAIVIGVHARRGDMLDCEFCQAPGDFYYKVAITRMRELITEKYGEVRKLKFLVASEGREGKRWFMINKEKGGLFETDEFDFIGSRDALLDLAVLSSCDHIIASGGTFSAWAAYLASRKEDTIVVHSEKMSQGMYDNPDGWITISDDGTNAISLTKSNK